MKTKAEETWTATKEYTAEEKNEFQKSFNDKLDALDKDIDDMKAKASEKTGDAKKAYQAKVDQLQKDKKDVEAKLDQLQNKTGKAWTQVKNGVVKSYDHLKASFVKAKEEMQK